MTAGWFDPVAERKGEKGDTGITPELRINAETNEWEVSYDRGATWTSLGVKAVGAAGATGATGATGAAGQDGKDGVNGTDGKDGIDGKDGRNGMDGANGKDNTGTPWLKPVAVTAMSVAGVSLIGLGGWILFLTFRRKRIL